MNEPNKTYSIDDIKELLEAKDKRTVNKHIDAAGYESKESYSESEVAWIREVQSIKQQQNNISYPDIKIEIERRKAEAQKQLLLGGSSPDSSTQTSNSNTTGGESSANSAVPAQPPVDSNFVGGLVENVIQEQINTHMVRCVLQLPTMMNKAIANVLPELEAAGDMALQQNRERLEPMRKIEAVETTEQNLIEGKTVEVESSTSEDHDEKDSG